MRRVFALLMLLVLSGCGSHEETSVPTPAVSPYDASCRETLALTLIPRTIWGTELAAYQIGVDGKTQSTPLTVDLKGKRTLSLSISAPDFFDEAISVTFDGIVDAQGVTVSGQSLDATKQVARRFHTVTREGKTCPAYTILFGLDHRWFAASGRPARSGNHISFYMNGESMWSDVYVDLTQATRSVHLASWWWDSKFELRRPEGHEELSELEREKQTIGYLLDALPNVDKRVLICQFAQQIAEGLAYLNTDRYLRDKGRDGDDRFEVMIQPNRVVLQPDEIYPLPPATWQFTQRLKGIETFAEWEFVGLPTITQALENGVPVASFHQKLVVVDSRVAYVTGMNIKSTDWDDSNHAIYNSRRMKFKSSVAERLKVKKMMLLPDLGPRKDYGVRVDGPLAQDVEDVFRRRWELGRKQQDLFSDTTTPFPDTPYDGSGDGTVTAQIITTMPAPITEVSIFESHLKAVKQAKHYIYIEDQYFRAPMLNDAILAQMEKESALRLIVVTKPVSDADGGKKYTVLGDAEFRKRFGARYLLLQLKSFVHVPADPAELREAHVLFQPMDVHSKIMIIDDLYLSLGSCNKNNRGYKYEGELNIAVLDQTWVTTARRRVISHLLGSEGDDDPAQFFVQLQDATTHNDAAEAFWRVNPAGATSPTAETTPQGFVYALSFTADYLLDVGPDFF